MKETNTLHKFFQITVDTNFLKKIKMIDYDGIDVSENIDTNKIGGWPVYIICHHW